MSSKIGDNSGNIQDSIYNRAQTPKNKDDNINIKDTFNKTGENDQGNLGLNILKAAGAGAVVGLGLRNASEIKELKERVHQLESEQPPGKVSELGSAIKEVPGKIGGKIGEIGSHIKGGIPDAATSAFVLLTTAAAVSLPLALGLLVGMPGLGVVGTAATAIYIQNKLF